MKKGGRLTTVGGRAGFGDACADWPVICGSCKPISSSAIATAHFNFLANMTFRPISRAHVSLSSAIRPLRRPFRTSTHRLDKIGVTRNEGAGPVPKSRTTGSQLPVFPLIAIFFAGSASFYWMVKTRQGQGQSHYALPERAPPKEQWPKSLQDSSK